MPDVGRLIWDPWNIGHIARHGVTPEEVEQVCRGPHVERVAYALRLMMIGPTDAGRLLAVVLERRGPDAYFVITARPASRKERRIYRDETRDEEP